MKRLWNIFIGRKLQNRQFQIRILITFGFLVLLTLMLPRSFRLNLQYEIGQPWKYDDLIAPFDFSIYKSQDSLDRDLSMAAADVLEIFVINTVGMDASRTQISLNIREFCNQLDRYRKQIKAKENAEAQKLLNNYFDQEFSDLKPEQFTVSKIDSVWENRLISQAMGMIDAIYENGFLIKDASSQFGEFIHVRISTKEEKRVATVDLIQNSYGIRQFARQNLNLLPGAEGELLLQILERELQPNYIYSAEYTEEIIQQRQAKVSPVYSKIPQGTLIISRGQFVSKEIAAQLESLISENQIRYGNERNLLVFLTQLVLIAVIIAILLVYLAVNRPRIYFDNNKLSLIFFTYLIIVGLMLLAFKLGNVADRVQDLELRLSFIYLAPACIVPIIMRNFFGLGTAFLCNLLTALIGAVLIQQDLEYAFVQTVTGTVAVYSMTQLRKREQFFYTILALFLTYSLSFVVYNMYSTGNVSSISYGTIALFLVNVLATMIAINLVFLLEKLFGITSDLTYLELLDTNHPLLKDMARKAPGTFQHSLQVASIAETVVSEIGGNELLIHVGALYHDIGKMQEQKYFIENMSEDEKRDSPHNRLPFEESAKIIIGHVSNGVELAIKNRLPKEIIQFIQTHHGSTRVEYFYRNYLKENGLEAPEGEQLFRYPGPKPFSKETAVLMIADSIEAASRAMSKPTPEKLEKLINNIIDYKIEDKQLEDSNLTFKDISIIRKVILKQLLSIHHARIEYPEEATNIS